MAKHFENLWELAEVLSIQTDKTDIVDKIIDINKSLHELINDKNISNHNRYMGNILFKLCGISHALNINTFSALLLEIQNRRVSTMGE